jgi:hypothetical protein
MLGKVRLSSVVVVLLVALSGCVFDTSVKLGDYAESSATVAESSLANLGLIPKLSEEHSDSVPEGQVIRTDPPTGSSVDEGGTVLVIVSSGPAVINPAQSQISWRNVDGAEVDWNYSSAALIKDNTLIGSFDLTMDRNMYWHDPNSKGEGFGEASITDTFDKVVPLKIIFNDAATEANEWQTIEIRVPLSDLDVNKPTTIYMKLFAWIGESYKHIPLTLTMSW